MAGILKIHSAIAGSTRIGHSWVEYCPIDGAPVTYGTWGNDPTGQGNGLLENTERNNVRPSATRSRIVDHIQEQRLFEIIERYRRRGEQAWSLLTPCSTFAAEAWEYATGERLVHQTALISTPARLARSIHEANQRDAFAVAQSGDRPPRAIGASDSSGASSQRKRVRKNPPRRH